jgi:hypothetical protein
MKNILELKCYCVYKYLYLVLLLMGAIDQLPPSLGFGAIQKWITPCIIKSISRTRAFCTSSTVGGILIAPRRIHWL